MEKQVVQTEIPTETLNPACFGCGAQNPSGLQLLFHAENRRSSAQWIASPAWQSYKGIIHGGIISAVLDEAMSKAILSGGDLALTVELRIRFRKKVCVEDVLEVTGWVVSDARGRIKAEAALASQDGQEMAHAWGTFLAPRHS